MSRQGDKLSPIGPRPGHSGPWGYDPPAEKSSAKADQDLFEKLEQHGIRVGITIRYSAPHLQAPLVGTIDKIDYEEKRAVIKWFTGDESRIKLTSVLKMLEGKDPAKLVVIK